MRLQIFQNEKLIDGEDLYHLEKDTFRIFVEQAPATESQILHVYATASDSSGMNDHLIEHGVAECWMYSCNFHSMARYHPFDLRLLRYEEARSLRTPEAITAHSGHVSKNAPRLMADLVNLFPHVSMGLDVGMNSFAGGEMYGGFHCSVAAIAGAPVREYKGEYLYLSLFLLMQKFTIPETHESLTLDLVKAHTFALRFKSGDPIRAIR